MAERATAAPIVLVVDDDPDLLRLVTLALHRRGFETLEASSGEEALRQLENAMVDSIVLDMAIPGMSGLEVIRALRAGPDTATLPILILTGSGDRDTLVLALEAGADDFLPKPVRLDELVARVRAHIRTSSAWTRHVETELRTRADVVRSLSGLEPSWGVLDTAATVVAELGRSAGYPFVDLLRRAEHGHLEELATYSEQEGVQRGGSLSPARAQYLLSRLRDGPWVDVLASPAPGEESHPLWSSGLEAAAGAPIYAADRLVGLLVIGAAGGDDATSGTNPSKLLAEALDYANILSVIAGPSIARQCRHDATQARLAQIIATKAFFPVFQPILDLATREIVGHEALTRFIDETPPELRFAEAALFGLDLNLETAAIEASVGALGALPNGGLIALNTSSALVLQTERLQPLLQASDRAVVLELTEHGRTDDYGELRAALAVYGPRVAVAVDDAGAGYSSLRHILELRPAYVKLDISIVRGIEDDPVRQALVSGLVFFAARTGSSLIAEGIETEAEASALVDLGIPLGQGFLLGRPAPVG